MKTFVHAVFVNQSQKGVFIVKGAPCDELQVNRTIFCNLRSNLFYRAAPVDFSARAPLVNLLFLLVVAVIQKIADDKKIGMNWKLHILMF